MSEKEKDNPELQGLVEKRDQLLAEVKKLKARVTELEGERDTANERADRAEAEVQRITVDNPVDDLLKDVFTVPTDQARKLLDGQFKFERGEDGIALFDAEGERVAGFDADEVKEALQAAGYSKTILLGSRASGSGGTTETQSAKSEPAPRARSYGLR
ncbi:MAG: hypothetical protein HND55_08820 [Pseudomonadota bacterium]|nr:MAG: hypothetical protein HND55_08820 [Pseudomonadota bacterium]